MISIIYLVHLVIALSDCHYASLAWKYMGSDPLATPSRIDGACCGKFGITCNTRNRIKSIVWTGLAGSISQHIFKLEDLIILYHLFNARDFSINQLSGHIPEEISSLVNLEFLYFYFNLDG